MFQRNIDILLVDGERIDRIALREKDVPLLRDRDGGGVDFPSSHYWLKKHRTLWLGVKIPGISVHGGGASGLEELSVLTTIPDGVFQLNLTIVKLGEMPMKTCTRVVQCNIPLDSCWCINLCSAPLP